MDRFSEDVVELETEVPGLMLPQAAILPASGRTPSLRKPIVTAYGDLMRQAVFAMRHDLRRTLLTMAGMAWGIATVVLLLAYGNGFRLAIQNIFAILVAYAHESFRDL